MAVGQLLMTGATRKKKKASDYSIQEGPLGAGTRPGAAGPVYDTTTRSGLNLRPEEASALENLRHPQPTTGPAQVGYEATVRARGRTEGERLMGINAPPAGYEPGRVAATDRPDSYFVNDPTRRAQVQASEARALMTNTPGRNAMGDPFGISRGAGGPSRAVAVPAPGTESAWTPEAMKQITGETERGRLAATDPNYRVGQPAPINAGAILPTGGGDNAFQAGRYVGRPLTAAEQGTASETQRRLQVMNAPAYDPAARAALRSQTGPVAGRQGVEELATAGAGGALMRAQAAAGAAVAPQMAQAGLEQTQAQTGAINAQANALNAMAKQALDGNVQTRQAVQDAMDSAIASGAPPEVIATLRDIQMGQFGMRQVPPGVLEQVYAILRPYAALLGGVLAGPAGAVAAGAALPPAPGPTYQPGGPASLITGPTAPAAGPPVAAQHSAAMSGRNWSPVANQPAVPGQAPAGAGQPAAAEQEERELLARLKAKYGG